MAARHVRLCISGVRADAGRHVDDVFAGHNEIGARRYLRPLRAQNEFRE